MTMLLGSFGWRRVLFVASFAAVGAGFLLGPAHGTAVLVHAAIAVAVVRRLWPSDSAPQHRAAEDTLRESEERFRLVFESAPVAMAMVRTSGHEAGRLSRVNAAMCDFTGLSAAELTELDVAAIMHSADANASTSLLADMKVGKIHRAHIEQRYRRADGTVVWGRCSASVVAPRRAHDRCVVLVIEDITDRREAALNRTHHVSQDPLTGLVNRSGLTEQLDRALAVAKRRSGRVGVLYLDLDAFKEVNDSLGHAAGDELLRQVASRLLGALRPGDTVARLGGDEFAVVCPETDDLEGLRQVADRVLSAVRGPFLLDTGALVVSGSLGMSMSVPNLSGADLLREAGEAMYAAKRGGKNRVHAYRSGDAGRGERAMRLLPEVEHAFAAGEFVLHGQPVVDLTSGRIVAVETLLRWKHPRRGLLPPSEFLDVAESSAIMLALGAWTIEESCRLAASWTRRLGVAAPAVHVNISGRQLESGTLNRDVLGSLQRHGLPAQKLVLELTETYTPVLADSLLQDLAHLRNRGVRIALDDVGTGYSSLSRITELPIDILKIDRRFVSGLGSDSRCDAVVRAVLGIGHALGLLVVAEGVETAQQATQLIAFGANTGQGYLYSAARPEEQLLDLLGTHSAKPGARARSTSIR